MIIRDDTVRVEKRGRRTAAAVLEIVTQVFVGSGELKKPINAKKVIVAKALDGQRYPLPLCECMTV